MGQIKAIITDLDGCLTDGGMYYQTKSSWNVVDGDCHDWELTKKFHTRDAAAARWLHENTDVKLFVITAGDNPKNNAINYERMKVMYLTGPIRQAVADKFEQVNLIARSHQIDFENIAYIGDDRADLEVLETAGIACCPKDALRTVQKICGLVSVVNGGHGVLADIVDKLLASGDIEEKKE